MWVRVDKKYYITPKMIADLINLESSGVVNHYGARKILKYWVDNPESCAMSVSVTVGG